MALRLHNTRLLDGGICCFNFIFEEFSNIGANVYSRPFFFAGSRWRLQGGVKGGQFGVFLRWHGGGQHTDKVKCKIRFSVEVINNRDPSSSVRAGNMTESDEFPKVAFGIGWSKLLPVEEIERPNSGFLDDNSLFLEVRCCMVHFLFEDKLVINLSSRTSYVSSSKFSLYDEEWYLVLYPKGEPKNDNSVSQKQEHASVYLHREEPGVLRFKATYSIFVRGSREVQVSHHFCNNNASIAFGIEKFARTKDLKAVSNGGLVSIGVKITSIEPYYYFGFETQGWSPPNNLGEGCSINDVFPLFLKPCSDDKKMLDFSLMFDPGPKFEHAELEDSAYYMKILWSVNVVCIKDFNRSVTVNSWDIAGQSAFCYSQDEMTMNTTLKLNEVLNPYSPYLDDEKNLGVRLVIVNANEVYDPLLINSDKHSVAKLREMKAQTKAAVENFWKVQLDEVYSEKDRVIADKEEEIATKEVELNQKEAAIQALENEITESNEYLAEIESTVDEIDGKKVSSIKDLVQEAQPHEEEISKQEEVAEKLKAFLMDSLPFSVSRILVVGAAGQGTTIKGYKEVELAVFVKDLPRTEHKSWLPAIVFTIKTLLKQEGSKPTESTDENQKSSSLPPCSDFVTTSASVKFKCDSVDVTLDPINDWEQMGGYIGLYKQCFSQPADAQPLGGEQSQAVRADKDVFLELADMVGDESLEVYWNEYYLAEEYPRENYPVPFQFPIVQDPAIPTHNVASDGLEDWAQFRRELSKWVAKLTL
ncbi:hypothetical protein AWC38_SpisGene6793 [Stylophora pistillata]|uniref:MATH domain-containing protein n=1 Tax=Stylophora pistillata TaxID=50429 RepID=A0A2B4SJC4_STYPI|nr:hypothetical protein AWC38_SpisGene6793 [Stylophora pistillata]